MEKIITFKDYNEFHLLRLSLIELGLNPLDSLMLRDRINAIDWTIKGMLYGLDFKDNFYLQTSYDQGLVFDGAEYISFEQFKANGYRFEKIINIDRDQAALQILCAIMSNPQRIGVNIAIEGYAKDAIALADSLIENLK